MIAAMAAVLAPLQRLHLASDYAAACVPTRGFTREKDRPAVGMVVLP